MVDSTIQINIFLCAGRKSVPPLRAHMHLYMVRPTRLTRKNRGPHSCTRLLMPSSTEAGTHNRVLNMRFRSMTSEETVTQCKSTTPLIHSDVHDSAAAFVRALYRRSYPSCSCDHFDQAHCALETAVGRAYARRQNTRASLRVLPARHVHACRMSPDRTLPTSIKHTCSREETRISAARVEIRSTQQNQRASSPPPSCRTK